MMMNGSGSKSARLGVVELVTKAGDRPDDDLDELFTELKQEFSAPLGLYDRRLRTWRRRVGAPASAFPDPEALRLDPHRALVVRPRDGLGGGPTWLILPVAISGGRDLLALAGFVPATAGVPAIAAFHDGVSWGPSCPEPALRAWGQSVADRLRAEFNSRLAREPAHGQILEPSVPDRLIRRLRVSDAPDRFQRLAAAAVREALDVEVVAWIPATRREPVVVAGELGGFEPDDFRALVPEPGSGSVWISNRADRPPPDPIRRIAGAAADSESPVGWLVAVNPLDDRPFVAEVELLQTVASLVANQRANARLYGELKELLFGVIRSLSAAIDAKDPYTSGHSERVARIAVRLGEELGLAHQERSDLYLMGLLHDIGKIGIEDEVLKKPGKLSPEEYRKIQGHVRIGVRILSDLKKLHHLLPGVAAHHEHLDGSGYPAGLAGEQIPLSARILAVADAFDAMSSSRPYRRRMSPSEINDVFRSGSGIQWDSNVVEALFACRPDIERIRQKGLGESVLRAVDGAMER